MVKVKCHNLLGEDFEAEYTEAQYAQLRERRRNQEEEERRVSDIWEAGLREHQRRQEEAARHPDLDAIDHALSPHLRKELEKENAATRVTAKAKANFKLFQACCAKWGLPHLPAPPQAVAVFLSEESERGAAHVSRLARSISVVHTACNFADPTTDVLVRALLRLVRTDKSSPHKKEQKHG